MAPTRWVPLLAVGFLLIGGACGTAVQRETPKADTNHGKEMSNEMIFCSNITILSCRGILIQ